MDNVNDKTYVPLEIQKENLFGKRRIGLGVMGYGSALMMMKARYGSSKALDLTDKLMSFIANTSYQASAKLAKEKGKFPLFDKEKYMAGNFIKVLSDDTKSMMSEFGLRNSHLLSIQPTGNSSVFANNVSGGLEPLFMPKYVRTTIFPYAPEGLSRPKNIDWENKTYETDGSTEWIWIKEGDENLLKTTFGDYVWKFDKSRGLLRETVVMDYAVRFLMDRGEWDPKAEWAATTTELTTNEHVDTMAIFAKYIDSAMSKTLNFPQEYPYEDFKKVYMDTYKTKAIKGVTTYRAGTMTSVLAAIEDSDKKEQTSIKKTTALKRPKVLDCDIHHLTVQGNSWLVLIGLMGKDPYEIFAFKKKSIAMSPRWKEGKLVKVKSGTYNLIVKLGPDPEDLFTLENLSEHFDSDEEEALTRMISTSLRHGADINFIYDQLLKAKGIVVSFNKAIARSLKKYIDVSKYESVCPECSEVNSMIMSEGCFKCSNCGFSKCG